MNETIIEFKNYGFQYNAQSKPTLYDINLSIKKGEKILIAGPSGSGKSTLVHCMNGLIPFSYKGESTGSLTLLGEETKSLSLFDISKHIGTVLQDSDAQFVGLTVAEDIAFSLENNCVIEPELHERVLKAARLVDIDGHLKSSPREISGGQKQRVSVAGVIVEEVDLLIFDEPLANLDPATGKQAIELIDEVAEQTGAAVIIIEHRLEDVLHRSVDRVVLMHSGRIIADMPSDELLSTELLEDHGIREPLYVTALKYAGVEIAPEKHPSNIADIVISETDAAKVRNWFVSTKPKVPATYPGDILNIDNLEFKYPNREKLTLKGITTSFKQGEMAAIVGTNGAGKSTFAKVICGLEDMTGGEIKYRGEDFSLLSIKERAEQIGYVMQNPNQMISKVMIYDEVAFGLRCRGVDEEEVAKRVEKALRICDLWGFRKWPVSALSFGQKKRVTVASILTLDPEMLILDEPTAGQDYAHYTEIMDFLERINKQGITVVMITHDMHLMLEYADRAVVFSDGCIIADDTCANILTNRDIVKKASLKETSLYELATKCGIDDAAKFVQRFIDYEENTVRAQKKSADAAGKQKDSASAAGKQKDSADVACDFESLGGSING